MRATVLAVALLAAAFTCAPRRSQSLNGFDLRGALINPQEIHRGGPPKDGIPAIDRPKFISADKAQLDPGDRILGVARGGEAKAYPVRILNWHEVVNDKVGGEPVAVTYCPLCGSGGALAAAIKGKPR